MTDWLGKRYYSLNAFFKNKFGEKVYRVSLDAGFTCPNRDGTKGTGGCIYCNEAGARASYVDPEKSIQEQLSSGMTIIRRKYGAGKFIAYFQAYSNTYAEPSSLEKIYKEALSHPDVVGISVGTRPDCVDAEKLNVLKSAADGKYALIEYGVQSMKNASLKWVNRGHSEEDTIRAIEETKRLGGIDVLAHLILGLPGETPEDIISGAKELVNLGVDAFKFHQLYVEKGTELEQYYLSGKLKVLDLTEYLDILKKIIIIVPENIVIHRLFGDCSRDTLLAPLWTLDKSKNSAFLDKMLEEKSLLQGMKL